MNEVFLTLERHHFGRWCKAAAWVIIALNLSSLLLQITQIVRSVVPGGLATASLPLSSLVQGLLSVLASALFSFFLLYGIGILVEHHFAPRER